MKLFHRLQPKDIQGRLFVTSDQHFSHGKILQYANRPFKTIEEHDEELIKRWNGVVGEGDTIICLGDFSMTSHNNAKKILSRLNGRKILIRGNHDRSHETMVELGFYLSLPNLIHEDFYMVHNPGKIGRNLFASWVSRPTTILAGHTHLKDKIIYVDNKQIVNMSCDAWDFTPVEMSQIWRHLIL
jgi:calcineurin-like phosphoesterase family protein